MSKQRAKVLGRHQQFLEQVASSGQVWGLRSPESNRWCVSVSTADPKREVMPFWSSRGDAQCCARDRWSALEPASIPIDRFMEKWLAGMAADRVLVGTQWDASLAGLEIEPLDLRDALLEQRQLSKAS